MKKLLSLLIMIFSISGVFSQSITNINIQGIDCNNTTGYIAIETDFSSNYYLWQEKDSLGNWFQIPFYSDSLIVNDCGIYRVIVFNGASSVDTSECFVPCPLGVNPYSHNNVLCFGDSTGSAGRVAYAGAPPYNYVWTKDGLPFSIGIYDTLLTNLFAGQYIVQISDSSGCVIEDTANVFQPNLLRVDSLLINSVHCKGTNTGSVVINIKDGKRYESGSYYNFYLTNTANDTIRYINRSGISVNVDSDTTPYYVQFDSLGVGNYTVHVVDSFACILDTIIYVMEPDNYILHVSTNPNIVCEQDSTWLKIDSVSGGQPILGYNWLGTSADSIYVRAGTYTAFINDLTYGCKDSLEYILTAPNTIYCNVSTSIADCYGTNTGSLQVDSIYGGVTPYSVQWGGVDTNNLYTGTYTLFITDSLGCIYMEDHEVLENPDVQLNETIITPLCNGDANGSISINISGGTAPLNYSWINGTGTPDSLFSLSTGTYVLQTIDDLGCIFSDTVMVSDPDNLVVNFSGFTNPLNCYGSQTLINANITGGTPPFNILWSNLGVTNQIVEGAGNYSVDVTDTNGCFATNQILITEPGLLEIIDTSFIQATCNIGATASVIVSGGTLPYSYIWSNGDTTSYASDLAEGIQWVIVTDSCGDIVTDTFVVESYILETDVYHYNNPDNFAEVETSPSNDGPPYSYQWYDENMNLIIGETGSIIEDLCPTWYYCITTDANNCEVTDSIFAELYFPMGGIVDVATTTVYDDNDLWGAQPYTYLWDNGDVTAHGNVCPGFHRVWVTDVNGCEVVGELTVDEIQLTLNPSDIILEC
ncbi:MAG: hypothetical protein HOA52_05340, partial [Flavobacteriales bacterium]|nr:hypothetical protein [Flavobacteriales bacterium]